MTIYVTDRLLDGNSEIRTIENVTIDQAGIAHCPSGDCYRHYKTSMVDAVQIALGEIQVAEVNNQIRYGQWDHLINLIERED